MKNIASVLMSFLMLSLPCHATIYGENDLTDIQLVSDSEIQLLGRSVAVQISNNSLDAFLIGRFRTLTQSLVCTNEPFIEQPALGSCSGFLIANNKLLTALHCFSGNGCSQHKWVFDFQVNPSSTSIESIPASNIYQCTKILVQSYQNNLDYAIVELDRPVVGRTPLTLDAQSPLAENMPIFSIHSPRGLPLKVSRGFIRDNSELNYFTSAIDLMRGSSGAPLFDANTNKVIGVVIQGDSDFELLDEPFCNRYKVCENQACRGEYGTRISKIPGILEFTKDEIN